MLEPLEDRRHRQIPSRTGVAGGREFLCGCWGSNLDPLEEQAVLIVTGLSLLP